MDEMSTVHDLIQCVFKVFVKKYLQSQYEKQYPLQFSQILSYFQNAFFL